MRLAELPPLANVLCCWDASRDRLAEWEERASRSRFTATTWRPCDGVVAASAPLPGAAADDELTRRMRLVFAEGRQLFDDRQLEGLREASGHGSELSRFAGDFTVVCCSPEGLTAIRSCGGLVPMWLWDDGDAAVVSSSLRWLLDVLPRPVQPDLLTCAMWASSQPSFPYGRSFFGGIRHLAHGHACAARHGRWAVARSYWDERAADGTAEHDPERHAAELREVLLSHLSANLPEDAISLLTLSGGVDSTSLAGVAGATLRRPLAAFTITAPEAGVRARELRFVDLAARHAGIDRRHEAVWTGELQQRLWDRPRDAAVPVVHPALLMLPDLLEQEPLAVLLGGEFADDLCGHWWRIQDWIDATGPLRLVGSLDRLPLGGGDLLRWPKGRWLSWRGRPRLPVQPALLPFFREDLKLAYAQWVAEERARLAADRRPNRFLAAQLRWNSDGPIAQNWETASLLGVRRLFPFHTREMLELAGRSDVREQLGPGTKRVMRLALAPDARPENLHRADKGQWGRVDLGFATEWATPIPASVAGALQDPGKVRRDVDINARLALQTLVDVHRALDAKRLHSDHSTPGS